MLSANMICLRCGDGNSSDRAGDMYLFRVQYIISEPFGGYACGLGWSRVFCWPTGVAVENES
jgi:hypothetical protein